MSDRPKTLRQAWWDTYQQWLDAVERQRPVETKDLTEARQHADAVVCGLSQVTVGSVIPEGA